MGRRARYLLSGLVLLVVAGGSLAWWLTKPDRWDAAHWEGLGEPDLANGERIFWAGGCVSCRALSWLSQGTGLVRGLRLVRGSRWLVR